MRAEIKTTLVVIAAIACLVALHLTLLGSVALAGTSGAISLPLPTPPMSKPVKSPFALTLDADWVDGEGYRPIRIVLKPTPVVTTDRTVTLRLSLTSYIGSLHTTTINEEVEVPAGSPGVSAVLLAPRTNTIASFSLDTFVDGEREEKLCIENSGLPASVNLGWAPNDLLTMLIVGDSKQDISSIAALSPSFLQYASAQNSGGKSAINSISQMPTLTGRAFAQLPEKWLEYTSIDTVCIAWSDLSRLVADEPLRWKALRDWLTSGGNLIVYDLGGDWARLPALEAAMGLSTAKASPMNPSERGWMAPTSANATITVGFDSVNYGNYGYAAPAQTPTIEQEPINSNPGFYTRDWQFGRVLAMNVANPFPGKTKDWVWIFNEIGPTRRQWQNRHGVNASGSNPDFWNFLISGVGLPPVTAFRILITLFVIVIGPVNYWVLMRSRRLHLLLFTVPASALLVTLALVSYGVISDGFGVRMRARSFTKIDQPNSQAACWSRQSYYASVAPSQGLVLPTDVAAYPLEADSDGQPVKQSHELTWDDRQHLTRGWLNSRTMTQFVLVRSRTSPAALKITPSGDGQLSVENKLGVTALQLLVSNDEGKWSFAQQLAPNAKAQLRPLTEEILSSSQSPLLAFNKAINEARPQTPADYVQATNNSGSFFGIRRRNYWRNSSQEIANQSGSRLEVAFERANKTLTAIRDPSDKSQPADSTPPGVLRPEVITPLGPRSYLAWVDRSPEVTSGLENPQEVESFHIIEGQW